MNTKVGGHSLVVAWDLRYESLGWCINTRVPLEGIDFFGNTPAGQLKRVETLRPGLFWHACVEPFPHTDNNRVSPVSERAAAKANYE